MRTEAGVWEAVEMNEKVLEVMKASRVLSGLPGQDLEEIASLADVEEYLEAELILCEGEPGEDLFLVLSGRVGVSARISGRSRRLAVLGPGEVFGEIAPLKDRRRSATVVALEKVEVARLPGRALSVVLEDFPLARSRLEELGTSRMLESVMTDLDRDGGDAGA